MFKVYKMGWLGLLLLSTISGTVFSTSNILYGFESRGSNPRFEEGEAPYFDPNVQGNISAIALQTAILHCRVNNLGVKTVSWIRQKDLHILTTGLFVYTSDERFSVRSVNDETGGLYWTDYVLQVKAVQPRDSGSYECQVSTEPRISKDFRLFVIETKAKIVGSPSEVYVKKGSLLNLVCEIPRAMENVSISWYHDGYEVIGGNNNSMVEIESRYENISQTSRLKVNNLQPKHSGNYSCLSPASRPAFTIVHVLNGEHPAAMQHSRGSKPVYSYQYRTQFLIVYIHYLLSLRPSR